MSDSPQEELIVPILDEVPEDDSAEPDDAEVEHLASAKHIEENYS